MNINDYLKENCIKTDVEAASMTDAIELLARLHENAGNIKSKSIFKSEIIKREKEMSSAILDNIALPHAKSSCVLRPAVAKITLKSPVLWNGKPVSTVYMLAAPDNASHIEMLSSLADSLQNSADNI